jgi:opacity protein-like surface antigen
MCCGAFFVSAQAHAQSSRLYFSGYLGLRDLYDQPFSESVNSTSGDLELDNGTSFSGALGLRLTRHFRLEGEISMGKNDFKQIDFDTSSLSIISGEMKSIAGLTTLYYDFDVDWPVQPFVSAGAGVVNYEVEISDPTGTASDISDDTTTFVWSVGGGGKYRVSPDFAFTGSYRYLASPELDVGAYNIDYSAHEFRIGFEYDLPVN